jgi:hypothetical protein
MEKTRELLVFRGCEGSRNIWSVVPFERAQTDFGSYERSMRVTMERRESTDYEEV